MLRIIICASLSLGFTASAAEEELLRPPSGTKRIFLGFKLTRIDSGSIYETVGLREGDILRTLNGRTVKSANDVMELPALLKRDGKVELKVDRGDKHVTLTYRIKTVPLTKRNPTSSAKRPVTAKVRGSKAAKRFSAQPKGKAKYRE